MPTRILIVDDSAFVRKVVRQMLSDHPGLEVVGAARNGQDALQMVESLQPDVVTCDLQMPELDGVGFVKQQMARKKLPILLLSSSPQDGDSVMKALEAGAVDFVQKPTALATDSLLQVRDDLIQKVTAIANTGHFSGHVSPVQSAALPQEYRRATHVDILVIGASTGGPQALRYLVPQFTNFPIPIVVVLHMPVGYTSLFAESLQQVTRFQVKEATENDLVLPGRVLIAPAGQHIGFNLDPDGKVRVQLSLQPSDLAHRPSVDCLFQAAAKTFGSRVMGLVLTGMGEDGKAGSQAIKAAGGIVLTESEESCIVYGMPRSVVEAGFSDRSVPLESIANEINKRL
jgi:two-component system chemotaxis response regulator CheB